MFTSHTSKFWNNRYREPGYAYGTAPNQFLTEQQHRIAPGMKALVIGDGEGRNGVWLASQGLDVLSVDLSEVGLEKAQDLAAQQEVQLQTQRADLITWDWPTATYDLVVSIFVHFAPEVRSQMHRAMLKALKPGGLIILEAFNPAQLQYQSKYDSGGPQKKEMLYYPEMLQEDFADGHIVELSETITTLHEGTYHAGKASVIRLIVETLIQ
ncbi:MAG: class I SAM-dependent methyltransferase [Thermosynechococcaceae cyanobacterium]